MAKRGSPERIELKRERVGGSCQCIVWLSAAYQVDHGESYSNGK